jgi:hypothetical protein
MIEERILDFLDGNLGTSEEEELLHRLAVSPERRNLLKQHLQMRELTSSLARRQYVPVPQAVTTSLFTTLAANGYAGPKMPVSSKSGRKLIASLEKNAGAIAQKITNTPSVFRRSSLIFASIVSFVAGGILIYLLMPETRQDKLLASASEVFQKNPAPTIAYHQSELTTSSTRPIANNSSATLISLNARDKSQYITDNRSYKNSNPSPVENTVIPPSSTTDNVAVQSISRVDVKYPNLNLATADIGGDRTSVNPFDHMIPGQQAEKSFLQRFSFSFRSGEGKAPGNSSALTGSLVEGRVSYDVTDWLVAKVIVGDFMSYEMQALPATPRFNPDGIPLLQLSPVSRTRSVLGAELGAKFALFSTPFEADAGLITDFQGNLIPRGGFFTKLLLNDNIDMNIGLEGMLYNHNILPSLAAAQQTYTGQHASLVGQLLSKETTGFIGPSIEMVWHF